jgi:anti-sigma-K factor RskA
VNRIPHDKLNALPPEDCAQTRDNLEAFALGALDSLDRGMVEHHLRWCEPCRQELARFENVTASLPAATPPVFAPQPATWEAIRARLNEPEDAIPAMQEPRATSRVPATPTRSRWSQYAYSALVVPLVIALVVMGAWINSLQNQVDDTNVELANQALLNSTLSEGGQVQLFSVERSCPNCKGTGQFGVSESNSMGMLVGWDFDPTVDHQVWGIEPNGERQKFCHLEVKADGAVMQMFIFPESPSMFTDLYIMNEEGELTYVSHLSTDDPSIAPGTARPSLT